MSSIDENLVRNIVQEVLGQLGGKSSPSNPAPKATAPVTSASPARKSGRHGIWDDVNTAAEAASLAQRQLAEAGVAARAKVVEIVKTLCTRNADAWGKFEFDETKIGNPAHKPEKLKIVEKVPGVEWFSPRAMSGDHGITLEEYTPFGVVGAVLPVTHSVPTLAGNVVNIVAAGNAVVFNPHPGGARSACLAVEEFNKAIEHELGISNLICAIENPTLESFGALCASPDIDIMVVTGGPGVVNAAMKSGKRSICAGPGNPPVVVDETADITRAAQGIIEGASFDNNLLCIGEKMVYVVDSIYQKFMQAMRENGAHLVKHNELVDLAGAVFTTKQDAGGCSHPVLNKEFVGLSAQQLGSKVGINVPSSARILIGECPGECPFVVEEQMTSMLPIVRVRDFDEAVAEAKKMEHGYKHSAMIHSHNVNNMTAMARALDTSVFVKNGPCTAGLGLGGEGYLSYSIATTTGEGITNPQTFTRVRRCVMVDNLRIY